MKSIILIIGILSLWGNMLWAQQTVTPNTVNNARLSTSATQGLTQQTTRNYIRCYTYRDADDTAFTKPYMTNIDIQYFDGLGRPIETVSVKASPTGKDLVSLQTYDDYGRNEKSYLPLAYSTTNNGAFVSETNTSSPSESVAGALPGFLSSNYELTLTTDNQYGFSNPAYEPSPLNRVLQQGAPGVEWQPGTTSSDHPVKYAYQTNTSTIPYYKYTGDTCNTSPLYYAIGSLYVNQTTDEDGNISKTYTDKQGKVVMKESCDGTYWLKTRYCYDDFGLLRCVLQPLATSPASTDYCFFYKYDGRHRMVEKKVPGSDWVYLIYDSRDRLVLTQDGVARPLNKWYYSKYDDLNRLTETGYIETTTIQSDLESYYATTITPYSATYNMQETFYYDEYPTDWSSAYNYDTSEPLTSGLLASNNKGLLLAKTSSVHYSGTTTYGTLSEMYYYDKYGRVIQSVKRNQRGRYEHSYNVYDFTGNILHTKIKHNHTATSSGYIYYVDIYYSYDHRGRLLKTEYEVDGNGTGVGNDLTRTIISENVYNEAGLLKTKYLHSQNNEAFLQKIDYKYNIRSWLTAINDPSLSTASADGDRFGMKLFYNREPDGGTSNVCYNGNIYAMQWGTPNYQNMEYTFAYDEANRLTSADFSHNILSTGAFDTDYGYNKNGNHTYIAREGQYNDDLSLHYSGNRLNYVLDYGSNGSNSDDYPGTESILYFSYDNNGNMTYEPNRSLNITYNQLNLPYYLDFGSNNRMINYYKSGGEKVYSKTLNSDGTSRALTYCGMFVYESVDGAYPHMAYIVAPEGRIVNNGTDAAPDFSMEYNLKDHLGNVRAVIEPTSTAGVANVLQQTHYYPFGMRMSEISTSLADTSNNYLYNGKEFQDDFGLNWYDYGARFYDAALGRWHVVDPLAQLFYSWSPYNYAYNSPVRYTDPDGSIPWDEVIKFTANSSNFGVRTHPITGKKHGHSGIDLGASVGSDVRALADGKIAYIGWNEKKVDGKTVGYGRYAVVEHGNGYYSLYAHLEKNGVKYEVGETVNNGDVIATSGNTGGSTGPHLHLEIIKAGGLYGVDGIFQKKNKLDPKSIKDLQVLLDQLNGKIPEIVDNRTYQGGNIDEVTVTAKGPEKPKPIEARIEDMEWSFVMPNAYGNTGRYNKPGRKSDNFYSDTFLKWWYDIKD